MTIEFFFVIISIELYIHLPLKWPYKWKQTILPPSIGSNNYFYSKKASCFQPNSKFNLDQFLFQLSGRNIYCIRQQIRRKCVSWPVLFLEIKSSWDSLENRANRNGLWFYDNVYCKLLLLKICKNAFTLLAVASLDLSEWTICKLCRLVHFRYEMSAE